MAVSSCCARSERDTRWYTARRFGDDTNWVSSLVWGRAGERGGRGDARGGFGGSVCRRVHAAGRLTVVSRASRRGGDEDLPTQVAGRSRHCSKNVAASKNARSAPAVRWFQGERTRACRLYTRGGSLNAGLSLPESTRRPGHRSRPVASTCARRELASSPKELTARLHAVAMSTQEIFESHI